MEAGQDILETRRISDIEIRALMHSARPKSYENMSPNELTSPQAVSRRLSFVLSAGLTTQEAAVLQAKWGPNVLEEKNKSRWLILWEQFSAPMVSRE